MEFSSTLSKFEKEQLARRNAAKKKIDDERRNAAKQRELEIAREKEAAIRAIEQARLEEENERVRQKELRLTGGIIFQIVATPLVQENAEDDRIILPQSALESLNSQNAISLGPLMFRVTANGQQGRYTHCGVREFTADEGTVLLPQKVIESLGITIDALSSVTIKFVILKKITFVKFRPLLNLFSRVGPVKEVLTENLRFHCTLTVGDRVTVWYRGQPHQLIVADVVTGSSVAVRGSRMLEDGDDEEEQVVAGSNEIPAGSLVDTDVEVDIDVSEEYTQSELAKHPVPTLGQAAATISGATTQNQSIAPVSMNDLPSQSTSSNNHTESSALQSLSPTANNSQVHQTDFEIDEEPPATQQQQEVITCRIRMPEGRLLTRRFWKDSSRGMLSLFHYVRSNITNSAQNPPFVVVLSTRTPPRRLIENAEAYTSFTASGISSNQEQFLVSLTAL
jgi:hypothetical protein